MARRRIDQIERKFQGLFHHIGNYPIEKGTDAVEARIRIDFYQPRFEATIYHEI
jgi:hypothetical protein